jgi:hypothetical protein
MRGFPGGAALFTSDPDDLAQDSLRENPLPGEIAPSGLSGKALNPVTALPVLD